MSRFIKRLDVEIINDTTWKLHSDLVFESTRIGRQIVVPEGFETDFASVPRVPFIYDIIGNRFQEAATVHDWLYTSGEVSRTVADEILRDAVIASGGERWMAYMMFLGVRWFGGSHYKR